MEKAQSENHTTNAINAEIETINIFHESFNLHLQELNISYTNAYPYLLVGEKKHQVGWIFQLSASIIEASEYVRKFAHLIPQLAAAIEIPKNFQAMSQILMGHLGIEYFNVIITIYPNNNEDSSIILNKLLSIDPPARYPNIPTAKHLCNNIFVKYGYHSMLRISSDDGNENLWGINADGSLTPCIISPSYELDKNIVWPFKMAPLKKTKRFNKIIGDQTIITKSIKNDIKGNVYKGLYFESWWSLKKCIIKSGNKGDLINLFNNDSADNIAFQYYIHKKLEILNIAPKAYDLVSDELSSYFVIEFIDGEKLTEIVANIQPLGGWGKIPLKNRKLILDMLLQMLSIVQSLHKCGIIHRDISLSNFILRKDKKLFILDFGLSFDLSTESPLHHPYTGATIGYTAPIMTDIYSYTPDYTEDIYSLGASMILMFTGMYPSYFDPSKPIVNQSKLIKLIKCEEVVNMIVSCFSTVIENRPTIAAIIKIVQDNYQSLIDLPTEEIFYPYEKSMVEKTIQNSINSIASSAFISSEGILESATKTRDKEIQANFSRSKSIGIYTGISGSVTMLMHMYDQSNTKNEIIKTIIDKNIAYLRSIILENHPYTNDLMNGSYGIGIALSQAIRYNHIEQTEENTDILRQLISANNSSINIWNGISGKGIFLLNIQNSIMVDEVNAELKKICDKLISCQNKYGTWSSNKQLINHFSINDLNWGMGSAGIIFFLLRCRNTDNCLKLDLTIRKGLDSLIKYQKAYTGDSSFIFGSTGVAQTFIKAYECYQEKKYENFVNELLETPLIRHLRNNPSYGDGLAGVGHIYLDAFKVFKKEKYLKMAEEIMLYILLLRVEYSEEITFWYNDITQSISADFLSGNMGILSFVKRFHNLPNQFDTIFDYK